MIRVLYVDDEPDLLEIGKIYLEEYGDFSIFIIDSALACLTLLKEDKFDAIISDYQMPGMDGIELLKHIRSNENDIPFIIFTGRGREEVVIEALNSGANFYLQKGGDPVAQFAELRHKILSAIANHRAEQKIHEKTEEMDKFFENALDLLCIADTNGNLRRLSRQWETTLGFSRSEMEGKPFFSFVHPDDIASTKEAVAKLSAGEPAVNFVNRYLCKDGSYRWIEWRSYPVGTFLYATALDITDRIKAEDEAKKNHEELEASYEELTATSDSLRNAMDQLAEKEKLYRTLFHEMLNGFAVHEIICDKNGKPSDYRFLEVNEAFVQMTGLSGKNIIGRTVLEVMPETEILWIERYGRVALTGLPDHFDNYSRALDKYYEVTAYKNAPGQFTTIIADVTQRKLDEMDIKKSEQKFRSLVEYSLEGILILDFSGNILFVNNAAARMIEVDDSSVLPGRNVMEFIAPESREDVIKDFIQVSQGNDAYLANYHVMSTKGKKIYVECIGKVITYEGKSADLLSIRDITKQQNAQHALQESSRKYAELFEMGSEAIFLIDNETGRLVEANAAASEMYGYSRDTLLTLKYPDLSAEKEDTNKITSETPQGTTIRVPLRHHRRSDGTVFPVEIISRFFTSDERPVHIAAIRDITERKQAEESLQESHDRFEQISGHSREMVWEIDPYGLYMYVSPACSEIIGYKPEELIKKKHFYDLHPKEGRQVFRASTLEAFTKKKVLRDFLNPRQTKEGKIIWMSTNGMPVFDEFNNFLGYRGSDSDITEQKEAEKIRTRFGRILESSLNEIYFFDAQTLRFVDVNHGARENIGYTIDELRNMTPLDIITEYTKESFETLLSPLRTCEKDIQVIFSAHKRKDGSLYPIEVHLQLAGNEVLPVFVAIILDITERRQIEEALRLANWKLNLLSGITRHDINNQMTVLQGYLSLLEMKQTDPTLDEYIQKMDASAKRISSMIQFTKEYEEIGITQPAWQDIRTIVTNAAKDISFGKIQLKNDLPVGMEVFSEPLIFKVFYNLMDNAVRYGDTITNIRFSVESRNGDRIIVCEDDGVGVPAIEKEKIFLRGFGKNTGLGLALSQEILEITGISIEECGEPGKGARFEMTVLKGMWRLAARTMGK